MAHDVAGIRELKKFIKLNRVSAYQSAHPSPFKMLTTGLVLNYSISRLIRVPVELAKKLRENENTKYGLPYSWFVKWATLYYFDEDGNEHEIEAEDDNESCKRADDMNWDEEEEED